MTCFCFLPESIASSSIIDLESVILSQIPDEEEDSSETILKSEKFQQDLFYMERVLMENIFQPKLAAYRHLPVLIGIFVMRHFIWGNMTASISNGYDIAVTLTLGIRLGRISQTHCSTLAHGYLTQSTILN